MTRTRINKNVIRRRKIEMKNEVKEAIDEVNRKALMKQLRRLQRRYSK